MSNLDDWNDGWVDGRNAGIEECLTALDDLDLICPCTANVAFWGHADHCPKRIVRVALEALRAQP